MASGPRWQLPFAYFDRVSLCWRTSAPSLFGDSIESPPIWPASGMTWHGRAFALPTWAPPIDAADGSLLPTPTGRDHKGRNQRDDTTCLPGVASALLPTPTARLGDDRGGQAKRYTNPERSNDLDDAVLWIGALSDQPSDAGNASSADPRHSQPTLFEDG